MCEFVSSATRLVSRVLGEPIAESRVVGEPIVESRVVGEPIAESRVVGEPLKQVGKYLYKNQGTPNNVTWWRRQRSGSIGRSSTAAARRKQAVWRWHLQRGVSGRSMVAVLLEQRRQHGRGGGSMVAA